MKLLLQQPGLRGLVRDVVLGISIFLFAVGCQSREADRARHATESRIDALIARMTLDEKLGQLNQYSRGRQTGPTTQRAGYREMVAAGQIGSMLNATGPATINEYQHIAMEQSRLKIPILFGLDVIHGYWTTFPIPLALSATWDPELIERAARVAAKEASADGVRWTFSPMVDIGHDPRWGRVAESAGEDPFLGAAFARAWVHGYQGDALSNPDSIAACAKHFVGYGAAEGGRDYAATEISENALRNIYLPPFHACVDAGAETLMSAFNTINAVPSSANGFTLTTILRNEWGFRGFVVSDWGAVRELIEHGIASNGAAAARKAITAGVDMDMESSNYLKDLPAEIRAGRVKMSTIDQAVRRVLRVKFDLGLFEHPYTAERIAGATTQPTDVELARTAAEESFVLLKNDASTLPLTSSAKTIAVVGPLADSRPDMLGCWSAKGDPANVITLRTAIEAFAQRDGRAALYEKGVDLEGKSEDGIAAAVDAAKRADVVLLALGEEARDMTGEASSRTRLDLPGLQPKLLDALSKTGKPIVLIIFSGRPLALSPYIEKAQAIVQAWHPGIQAGPALVRVLSGDVNFSGRLTMSIPRSVGQSPIYYNRLSTGRPLHDPNVHEKYLSGYIDEKNSPLYPFGYGLSYTTFAYSKPTISATSISATSFSAGALNDGARSGAGSITVSAQLRNTGSRDGVETAQLYVRLRGTSVARPVRELKGFQRVALRAGESRPVEFTLAKDAFAFWNAEMKFAVEPAKVTLWITTDSQSGEGVELDITE